MDVWRGEGRMIGSIALEGVSLLRVDEIDDR